MYVYLSMVRSTLVDHYYYYDYDYDYYYYYYYYYCYYLGRSDAAAQWSRGRG